MSPRHHPTSINVEMIGTGLVVQYYVYKTAEKDHCHMGSISGVRLLGA
jgi:hypothetical protein